MTSKRKINLEPGEEIIINGYHIRAVGPPASIQVYRPEAGFDEHGTWRLLYAGLAGDVLCQNSINIGAAVDLANSDGWPKAIATAKSALEN
ncbi:hypothetical protein LCGC14_2514820 [marine sediment metagenome]|uniref:Uncharacterized protein n=1 Tax=marine sediment metagenome TaxID=412755 RepID=A0A0F9BL07_9ZZZZ